MSINDATSAGGGSILDKVIASKEDQEKRDFDPSEVINQLLKTISDKEADVLRRRFGLGGKAKETLEAIGNSYNVTRERVRQIENLAVKKIKEHSSFVNMVKPVEHVVLTVLEENGGIMNEAHLLEELFTVGRSKSDDQAVLFMISELFDFRFTKVGPNAKFEKSWQAKTADLDFVIKTIEMLIDLIKEEDQPMELTVLYNRVKEREFYKLNAENLNRQIITSYLQVSKKIAVNPFGEYGLRSWGSVMPRRMNDKIYLVLKKMGKPMHFVDIAKQVSEVFNKEAYPPTVHNELILNKHYVLVGRGIYALKEWGYKKGVVADVIIDVMRKRGNPMQRDEIVDAVLKERIVKKNTIHLALTNRETFIKLSDGRFTLKESISE
ncbi:MAG: sigma factor-like helix-turn-helix DNA-binding protein [bacterium]|nr:sigma factor-like helix-turn-helix DNA-binding protein [bacterium]